MTVNPIHAGEQQSPSVLLCLVTLLSTSGEELRPIQAGEQQSASVLLSHSTW